MTSEGDVAPPPGNAPPDDELARLRTSFRKGAAAVLAGLLAVGAVVALFGSNADRPAGIAERWLVAVGDSTRDGLAADARHRAEDNGLPVAFAVGAGLLDPDAVPEGERAFDTIRVGRAVPAGSFGGFAVERVPFVVAVTDGEEREGHVYLLDDERWQVLGLQLGDAVLAGRPPAAADAVLPAPAGPVLIERPERVPVGYFGGALVLGLLVLLGCRAAIRAATPAPASPPSTASTA